MIKFNKVDFTVNNQRILSNLSLHIKRGEKVVLHGASGCGKSTILLSIMGFVTPSAGDIFVDERLIESRNIDTIRGSIAWLPQDLSLPYKSVRELIFANFEFRKNRANTPSEDTIDIVLRELGLSSDILSKELNRVSGGERQRIMLCIAKLLDKPIILLDEPTSALDSDSANRVIEFIKGMEGKTIISVSHDPKFISAFNSAIKIG